MTIYIKHSQAIAYTGGLETKTDHNQSVYNIGQEVGPGDKLTPWAKHLDSYLQQRVSRPGMEKGAWCFKIVIKYPILPTFFDIYLPNIAFFKPKIANFFYTFIFIT